MPEIGKYNSLKVLKKVDFGYYLDGENFGEILLPKKYADEELEIGSNIDIFLYSDTSDRLIATTEKPFAQVDDFAYLEVVDVNQYGAFLDWGITKQLLVPFREQKQDMEVNHKYIVKIYLDLKTNRIAASAKIDRFLDLNFPEFDEGEQVEVLIVAKTDLGYKVIINNEFSGILYENEVFKKISKGERHTAYIKKVREDDKIDVSLSKPSFEKVDDFADVLIEKLKQNNGFMEVNDKSSADLIYDTFGVSKKTFKKAVGALYKKRLIIITDEGLKIAE